MRIPISRDLWPTVSANSGVDSDGGRQHRPIRPIPAPGRRRNGAKPVTEQGMPVRRTSIANTRQSWDQCSGFHAELVVRGGSRRRYVCNTTPTPMEASRARRRCGECYLCRDRQLSHILNSTDDGYRWHGRSFRSALGAGPKTDRGSARLPAVLSSMMATGCLPSSSPSVNESCVGVSPASPSSSFFFFIFNR